ncbi:hypothetical protein STEG23_020381, partial [Scotinomys teguina]
ITSLSNTDAMRAGVLSRERVEGSIELLRTEQDPGEPNECGKDSPIPLKVSTTGYGPWEVGPLAINSMYSVLEKGIYGHQNSSESDNGKCDYPHYMDGDTRTREAFQGKARREGLIVNVESIDGLLITLTVSLMGLITA